MEPQKAPPTPTDYKPTTDAGASLVTPSIDEPAPATPAEAPVSPSFGSAHVEPEQPQIGGDSAVPAEPFVAPQTFKPDAPADTAPSAPVLGDTSTSPQPLPVMPDDALPGALPVVAPRPRKKGLIIGSIIAAVAVVLFGGAAAAYYYTANKPQNILLRALANSLDETKTQTMHVSGVFSGNDNGTEVKAAYTGAFGGQTGAMDLSAKLDVLVANITFDLRSVDGKSMYVKVGGLSGLPELLSKSSDPIVSSMDAAVAAAYAPVLEAVNDQWFEINESLIKQATGGVGLSQKFSTADRKKLASTYKQHAFLVIKKELASERIKGTDSYHYQVVIDKAILKEFAAALKAANISGLKITDAQLEDFNDSLKDAKLDAYPVDVWIAKDSKMITQLAVKASQDDTTVDFTLTVASYNKPVTVEKPEDAKSILEVLGSFIGGQSTDPLSPMPILEGEPPYTGV